jgi:type IV secretory pathway TrbF-like protein
MAARVSASLATYRFLIEAGALALDESFRSADPLPQVRTTGAGKKEVTTQE